MNDEQHVADREATRKNTEAMQTATEANVGGANGSRQIFLGERNQLLWTNWLGSSVLYKCCMEMEDRRDIVKNFCQGPAIYALPVISTRVAVKLVDQARLELFVVHEISHFSVYTQLMWRACEMGCVLLRLRLAIFFSHTKNCFTRLSDEWTLATLKDKWSEKAFQTGFQTSADAESWMFCF